jgi:hypothetical protein
MVYLITQSVPLQVIYPPALYRSRIAAAEPLSVRGQAIKSATAPPVPRLAKTPAVEVAKFVAVV